ncbi:MAG: hypothetical protein GXP54_01390, partial [Deltaproteobacteria bacterium]|nr:hypothetical protein [Deltaproteobacteria bacterium]
FKGKCMVQASGTDSGTPDASDFTGDVQGVSKPGGGCSVVAGGAQAPVGLGFLLFGLLGLVASMRFRGPVRLYRADD